VDYSTAVMSSESFDPSKRRLCPDGTCIGLLDDGGRCKICDRSASGNAVAASDAVAESEPAEPLDDDAFTAGSFAAGRRLCDDGACVGVIGPSDVCSVCGRRAEG